MLFDLFFIDIKDINNIKTSIIVISPSERALKGKDHW